MNNYSLKIMVLSAATVLLVGACTTGTSASSAAAAEFKKIRRVNVGYPRNLLSANRSVPRSGKHTGITLTPGSGRARCGR